MMDAMTIWDGICSLNYFRYTDMVGRRPPLFSGHSHRLTDPIPEQSRPLRAEGPALANQ